MQDLFEAIVLGIVQGLTEFIPVSSSGHLVLAEEFFGFAERSLAFDVALHIGTLGAVLVFFRVELLTILRGFLGGGDVAGRRLGALLVIASIPVAVIGLAFRDTFERVSGSPLAATLFLYVTAAVLVAGEQWRQARVRRASNVPVSTTPTPDAVAVDLTDPTGTAFDGIRLRHALVTGTGQCLALFAGVSRSGSTIAAGMASGLTREAATRFSFLVAIPALVGAAILTLPDLASEGAGVSPLAIIGGVIAAFISGYAAIRWLVALVARRGLYVFAAYCAVVATISLIVLTVSD